MLTDKQKRKVENRFSFYLGFAKQFGVNSVPKYSEPELACVYAFEMSDNTVKIGVTTNPDKRVKSVKSAVYLDVLRSHCTGFAPINFMRIIEARCHAAFAGRCVRGEYFSITFEEAVVELDRHADEIAAVLHQADENFIDEFNYYEELKEKHFPSQKAVKSTPTETSPVPVKKTRRQSSALNDMACINVFLVSNGNVKISSSDNMKKQVFDIKGQYGVTVEKFYQTSFIPREVARAIEKACLKIFSSSKVEGEFFSVDFDLVCATIDALVELVNNLPLLSKFERAEKLLAIADRVKELPEDKVAEKSLLLQTAYLFVGKELV